MKKTYKKKESLLKLFRNSIANYSLLLIIFFLSSIIATAKTKFEKSSFLISSQITVNYHPISSYIKCRSNKNNSCFNNQTISNLLLIIEERLLKNEKINTLSIDFYKTKYLKDFKSFYNIMSNSKFQLDLTTNEDQRIEFYKNQFKEIEEEFNSSTILEVENEIKLNSNLNKFTIRDYSLEKKDNDYIYKNESDNIIKSLSRRILFNTEKGINSIEIDKITISKENWTLIQNLLFFNIGGGLLFALLKILESEEKKNRKYS